MRMKDGPSVDVEISIAASPDKVWALLTDLQKVGEWSPEYQGGEWTDGATGPAVGAKFKGRNAREGREWETVSVVTEAEPGRSFAWAVGTDPANAAASWRFDLSPDGAGTKVRQHVTMGPGPSGLTAVIERMPDREEDIVRNRCEEHRRNMTATLEGLKQAAES